MEFIAKKYPDLISSNIKYYLLAKKIKSFKNPFKYYRLKNFPTNDVINCGAPRSGSTLLYLIISKVIEKKDQLNGTYCQTESEYAQRLYHSQKIYLSKTHTYSYLITKRVEEGRSIGFFTHRDIRDVIVSLIQKGWMKKVDDFLNTSKINFYIYDAILYASTKNMAVISYQELIREKKKVIEQVSKKLDVALECNEIREIIRATSIKSVKRSIENSGYLEKDGRFYNQRTGLHQGHINDPEPGKWKSYLTESEIKKINSAAREYLDFFNYPVD